MKADHYVREQVITVVLCCSVLSKCVDVSHLDSKTQRTGENIAKTRLQIEPSSFNLDWVKLSFGRQTESSFKFQYISIVICTTLQFSGAKIKNT